MVCEKNLTFREKYYRLDKKSIGARFKNFSIPQRKSEVREINNSLRSILPKNKKIDILAKAITMKSVMTIHTNKDELKKINQKHFFHTVLKFTKTDFTKKFYISLEPVNISGIDNILQNVMSLMEILQMELDNQFYIVSRLTQLLVKR